MDASRAALIVASYEYQDPGLRRLRAPAKDAEALAGVLRDPNIGNFNVRVLLNEPEHTVSEVVEEFFADRKPDDLLLLHFSCHGVKDEGGELYFATANTKLRLLGATAVAAEFVNRCMNRSRSKRVVLLLDCCYAGAFERGMVARADRGMAIEERFGGRGRAVITASSAMEYAFEGDELADSQERRPSLFTSALVEGLETGEADRDQDGYVGIDELYDYVYDRVQETTPNQTPGKWTFGVQGDLYIARRSSPVTTPAPLPPELQEAIGHPLAGIRVGAVEELERLLQSAHPGVVLAARLALDRLAADDSQRVSSAAKAVLGREVATVAQKGKPISPPIHSVSPVSTGPRSAVGPRVEPPPAATGAGAGTPGPDLRQRVRTVLAAGPLGIRGLTRALALGAIVVAAVCAFPELAESYDGSSYLANPPAWFALGMLGLVGAIVLAVRPGAAAIALLAAAIGSFALIEVIASHGEQHVQEDLRDLIHGNDILFHAVALAPPGYLGSAIVAGVLWLTQPDS